MATYVSYAGQPHIVNLDNTDFIRRKNSASAFYIEFYKSERVSTEQKPIYIVAWMFNDQDERDKVLDGLLFEHGVRLEIDRTQEKRWNVRKQ